MSSGPVVAGTKVRLFINNHVVTTHKTLLQMSAGIISYQCADTCINNSYWWSRVIDIIDVTTTAAILYIIT